MTHINDGGPAFPMVTDFCPLKGSRATEGMSLRDWFAGQALAGYAATAFVNDWSTTELVRACFADADAMLAEREKHRTTPPVSDTESELAQQDREL